jgi:hypothetical protein
MALDDRDYMRDRARQRAGYTESSNFRRSYGGEKDYRYFPKMFRGQRAEGNISAGGTIWRTLFICLAVYGALAGVRDMRSWYDKKQAIKAAAALQLERERKERAWSAFYQQPAYCNYAVGSAQNRCMSERTEARRQFERLYAAGQL